MSYVIKNMSTNRPLVCTLGDGKTLRLFPGKEETISDNKSLFPVHDAFQFFKCNRKTALFEIDFRWSSEPKHIFSPFSNDFIIEKIFDTNVI